MPEISLLLSLNNTQYLHLAFSYYFSFKLLDLLCNTLNCLFKPENLMFILHYDLYNLIQAFSHTFCFWERKRTWGGYLRLWARALLGHFTLTTEELGIREEGKSLTSQGNIPLNSMQIIPWYTVICYSNNKPCYNRYGFHKIELFIMQ